MLFGWINNKAAKHRQKEKESKLTIDSDASIISIANNAAIAAIMHSEHTKNMDKIYTEYQEEYHIKPLR